MKIILHPQLYSVNLLSSDADLQNWLDQKQPLISITHDRGAWTVVCPVPHAADSTRRGDIQAQTHWGCFEVAGLLEFDAVGILAELSEVLGNAGISIYALSSFTTDYVLVISDNVGPAAAALRQAGHEIVEQIREKQA